MPIHFGTDGWRAVISDSFTFDNLRIVAQAIADAVASESWDQRSSPADKSGGPKPDPTVRAASGVQSPRDGKKIVVGFDTRLSIGSFRGRSGARAGRQRIHRPAFAIRRADPSHFVCGQASKRNCRSDDHGFAQCAAL